MHNRTLQPDHKVLLRLESNTDIERVQASQLGLFTRKFHNSVSNALGSFNAEVLEYDNYSYLATFKSASSGVLCALKLQSNFKYVTPGFKRRGRKLNIALSTLDRESDDSLFLEKAKLETKIMCREILDRLVISYPVKVLYRKENREALIDKSLIKVIREKDMDFLMRLENVGKGLFPKQSTSLTDVLETMDLSYDQFYTKLKRLTGKSPTQFMRDYRLRDSLLYFRNPGNSVSEVARKCGFASTGYFSKCFNEHYGITPSTYARRQKVR